MLIPNHSPWIKQLKRTREVSPVNRDLEADIAIVGGGIAGVVTAFFALRDTDKSVILLEADKIAHGATGHNAGQITSYFERPLSQLVEEFGFDLAIDGQRSVESGWMLLDEIIDEAKLQTPLYRFTGYTGLSTLEQILVQLKNNHHRIKGGLPAEQMVVASEWEGLSDIPAEYAGSYDIASHKEILSLLESDNSDYVASLSYRKGCMNSAMFSEELAAYLTKEYKGRFTLHEGSPVKNVRLTIQGGSLDVLGHTIKAGKIVLCTNGFEYFSIINEGGSDIDTTFHHSVAGRIGYMSGYVEALSHPPTAISYLPKPDRLNNDPTGEEYFYFTRRPHEHQSGTPYNLVCAGGPEKVLPNGALYSREEASSDDMKLLIDRFLRDNYDKYPENDAEYSFSWHGLMGYTPNGIRRVGPEPCNPVLLYNLGCNGVGILPSVFGGKRISRFLKGEDVERSIFDPQDSRCDIIES